MYPYKILKSQQWRGFSPLNKLNKIFWYTKNIKVKSYNFRVTFESIKTIYNWISVVLDRIDSELYNGLGFMRGVERASKGESIDYTEVPPSDSSKTNVDIITLILFIVILMDEVTRLFRYSIDESNLPKNNSFASFKEDLVNFMGEHVSELNEIVQDTDWYQDLKDFRDFSITHRGDKDNLLAVEGDNVGILLAFTVRGTTTEKFFSNIMVDEYSKNVYNFLSRVSDFYEKYENELPFNLDRIK